METSAHKAQPRKKWQLALCCVVTYANELHLSRTWKLNEELYCQIFGSDISLNPIYSEK